MRYLVQPRGTGKSWVFRMMIPLDLIGLPNPWDRAQTGLAAPVDQKGNRHSGLDTEDIVLVAPNATRVSWAPMHTL